MPMMPFMGVRISWLTVARKRDFAWLAYSARSRALIRAVSARLRGVMSRAMARCETWLEVLSRTDSSIHENHRTPPSQRIATSVELRHSPSAKAASGTMPTSTPSSESVSPDQIPLVDADQIREHLVGIDDPPFAVAMHDQVAQCVDQAAKALLALLQLPHPVGEILDLGPACRLAPVDDAGGAAVGAHREREHRDARKRRGEQPRSDIGRCAGELSKAGDNQDGDVRRQGQKARCAPLQLRRCRCLQWRRNGGPALDRLAAGRFIPHRRRDLDLAGLRDHAQSFARERLGKLVAHR